MTKGIGKRVLQIDEQTGNVQRPVGDKRRIGAKGAATENLSDLHDSKLVARVEWLEGGRSLWILRGTKISGWRREAR